MRFTNGNERHHVAAAADLRDVERCVAIDRSLAGIDQFSTDLSEEIIIVMRRGNRVASRHIPRRTLNGETLFIIAIAVTRTHHRMQRDNPKQRIGLREYAFGSWECA